MNSGKISQTAAYNLYTAAGNEQKEAVIHET